MKTTIEIKGFEVKVEELDGVLMLSVAKDGEIIEEMEIGGEEDFEETEDEEVQDFEDFEDEEDDEEDDEEEEEGDDDEDEEFEDDKEEMPATQTQIQKEAQLESFSAFISKKR